MALKRGRRAFTQDGIRKLARHGDSNQVRRTNGVARCHRSTPRHKISSSKPDNTWPARGERNKHKCCAVSRKLLIHTNPLLIRDTQKIDVLPVLVKTLISADCHHNLHVSRASDSAPWDRRIRFCAKTPEPSQQRLDMLKWYRVNVWARFKLKLDVKPKNHNKYKERIHMDALKSNLSQVNTQAHQLAWWE